MTLGTQPVSVLTCFLFWSTTVTFAATQNVLSSETHVADSKLVVGMGFKDLAFVPVSVRKYASDSDFHV